MITKNTVKTPKNRRKGLIFLHFLLLLAILKLPAKAEEVLFQADFDDTYSATAPAGWTAEGNGGRWEKAGHLGGRSLYIGNIGQPTLAPVWRSKEVKIKGGNTYKVSAWVARGVVFGSDNTYGLEVRAVFQMKSGRKVSKRTVTITPTALGVRRTRNTEPSMLHWKYKETIIKVPDEAESATFEFRHSMGGGASLTHGEGWLDSLLVTPAKESKATLNAKSVKNINQKADR